MPELRGSESRRSTRVPLKVVISARGMSESLTCEGETIVVSCHGALISCAAPLRVKLKIEIHVLITGKRAAAKVVYVDPDRPQVYGVELDTPENIWGLSFPPEDWLKRQEI